MKRLFLALAVAVLMLEAGGIAGMFRPEPCPPGESASEHENCSTTCMRCACCAQPIVQAVNGVDSFAVTPPARSSLVAEQAAEDPQVRDITHVPKSLLS